MLTRMHTNTYLVIFLGLIFFCAVSLDTLSWDGVASSFYLIVGAALEMGLRRHLRLHLLVGQCLSLLTVTVLGGHQQVVK